MTVASLDTMPAHPEAAAGAAAADMQTLAVLATARRLGVAAAALLIATDAERGETLTGERLDEAAKGLGRAASEALSNPQVEG